jgi:hypothetical protein
MSSSWLQDNTIGALPLASGSMPFSLQAEIQVLAVTNHVTFPKGFDAVLQRLPVV